MTNEQQSVIETLRTCGKTYHTVYKKTDGSDPEWALWYAHWLFYLSDLPSLLPPLKTESELVYILVLLDKQFIESAPPEDWQTYYAKKLINSYR